MLKFLADEDFNNRIVRGLRRRSSNMDILRVQEVGLLGKHDTEVLEWAAKENRILLTHDAATMIHFANRRVSANLPMPGLVAIPQSLSIGVSIDDLSLISEASEDGELEGQIVFPAS